MKTGFAANKIEFEAKRIEACFTFYLEPHHLHDALQYLGRTGELERVRANARRTSPRHLKA